MEVPDELLPEGRVVLGDQPHCPHCARAGREVGEYDDRVFECVTAASGGDACSVLTFVGPDGESAGDRIPTTADDTGRCPDCDASSPALELGRMGRAGIYVCPAEGCRVEIHGRS
ncbi:MAG: hypothetical protein ABEI75_00315 [Halobaculum sp.]